MSSEWPCVSTVSVKNEWTSRTAMPTLPLLRSILITEPEQTIFMVLPLMTTSTAKLTLDPGFCGVVVSK